jgi:hypothetical protein
MTEIEAFAEVLKNLGVSSLFSPMLAVIILFYLARKYILCGAGAFISRVVDGYLKQNNERVAMEVKIETRLSALADKFEEFVEKLIDIERRNSERIAGLKQELTERLTNVEVVLSDRVFEELKHLRDGLREQETLKKTHTKNIAEMDTEAFRKARQTAQKGGV